MDQSQPIRVAQADSVITVAPGERVDLVVTRPVGVPEQLAWEWPEAPEVQGAAVRFVGRRVVPPPAADDGGITRFHYELEAITRGEARVVLVPRPASRDATQAPVVLDVTVQAAGADAAANSQPPLPDIVAQLVEAVTAVSVTPIEIARRLGAIEEESDGAIYVRPSDSRLRRVIVVKQHQTGDLNDVQFQLAKPGALIVDDLARRWGRPARPPNLVIGETKLVFRPPARPGARFRATVALTLDGDETGPVTWVAVIRDAI